jgi:hypothetical protein
VTPPVESVLHFTDERVDEVYGGSPLTASEREFLVTDTPRFEECWPDKEDSLREMEDPDLMRRCYAIWCDYAKGQM